MDLIWRGFYRFMSLASSRAEGNGTHAELQFWIMQFTQVSIIHYSRNDDIFRTIFAIFGTKSYVEIHLYVLNPCALGKSQKVV